MATLDIALADIMADIKTAVLNVQNTEGIEGSKLHKASQDTANKLWPEGKVVGVEKKPLEGVTVFIEEEGGVSKPPPTPPKPPQYDWTQKKGANASDYDNPKASPETDLADPIDAADRILDTIYSPKNERSAYWTSRLREFMAQRQDDITSRDCLLFVLASLGHTLETAMQYIAVADAKQPLLDMGEPDESATEKGDIEFDPEKLSETPTTTTADTGKYESFANAVEQYALEVMPEVYADAVTEAVEAPGKRAPGTGQGKLV